MYRLLGPNERIQTGDEYKVYWNDRWSPCGGSIGEFVYALGSSIEVRRKVETTATTEEIKHLIEVLEL